MKSVYLIFLTVLISSCNTGIKNELIKESLINNDVFSKFAAEYVTQKNNYFKQKEAIGYIMLDNLSDSLSFYIGTDNNHKMLHDMWSYTVLDTFESNGINFYVYTINNSAFREDSAIRRKAFKNLSYESGEFGIGNRESDYAWRVTKYKTEFYIDSTHYADGTHIYEIRNLSDEKK
jgi:hypothetical protein